MNTDKIAAEAAALWMDGESCLGRPRTDEAALRDLIQAACEKAERAAHKEGYSAGLADANRLRAAHASEPSECFYCRFYAELRIALIDGKCPRCHKVWIEPVHASDGGVCPECGTQWTKHGTFCGQPAHASEQGPDIDGAVQYILNVCNVRKPDQQYAESGDPLTQRERVREIVATVFFSRAAHASEEPMTPTFTSEELGRWEDEETRQ